MKQHIHVNNILCYQDTKNRTKLVQQQHLYVL